MDALSGAALAVPVADLGDRGHVDSVVEAAACWIARAIVNNPFWDFWWD